MRWQYILAAVIGAFLCFAGQFIADTAGVPAVFVSSALPGEFADEPHPYSWAYGGNGRSLGTPYQTIDGKLGYPGLPKDLPKRVMVAENKKAQWKALWYQLLFLDWLHNHGEDALQRSVIGAVLSPFLLFAVGRFRAKRKTRSAASAS